MVAHSLRVLVIGAGSIGARHAANLAAQGAAVAITDPDAGRANAAGAATGAETAPFDLERMGAFDAIVVASPTRYHRVQAEAALAAGARVLVEKPLDMTAEGIGPLLEAAQDRLMVGYNLRLHAPVQRLVSLVEAGRCGKPLAVRLWFGSYLPDWRPAVDYRSTYSARAELGGGILMDAIHELDLAVWLLGDGLEVIGSVVQRVGTLDINVEDTVRALLRHPGGTVAEVSLDYLSRRYRRGIEVIGEEATLRLDWARGTLETENRGRVDVEDATTPVAISYEREVAAFLAFAAGEAPAVVDAATGAASLRLADRIRQAAR